MSGSDRLQSLIRDLGSIQDRQERIQALISLAEEFDEVPESIATRPYDDSRRVPGCESEVFAWVVAEEGRLYPYFAVENPQGLSARALAVLLKRGLSGELISAYQRLDESLVAQVFGQELSMGKTLGLTMMVRITQSLALKAVN